MGGVLLTAASTAVLVATGSANAAPRTDHATASPTPEPSSCGVPDRWYLQADPTQAAAGEQVTVSGVLSIKGCHNQPPRHVTLLAAPAGTSDYRAIATQEFVDDAGRFSFLAHPTSSTSYNFTAEDVYGHYGPFDPLPGEHDVIVTDPSGSPVAPTPTPSPVQTPHQDCRAGAQVTLDASTITATGSATVTVKEIPDTVVDLFAYTRPSTEYRLIRSAPTNADGIAMFTIRPPANTRLKAAQREEDCTDPAFGTEPSLVLNVRTALTLTAARSGARDYSFAGDSLPARPGGLIVSLYRITDSGSQVLTAQARADAENGEWIINRVFTGTGRFGFAARTGQDLQNAPGVSNTRSTLIY